MQNSHPGSSLLRSCGVLQGALTAGGGQKRVPAPTSRSRGRAGCEELQKAPQNPSPCSGGPSGRPAHHPLPWLPPLLRAGERAPAPPLGRRTDLNSLPCGAETQGCGLLYYPFPSQGRQPLSITRPSHPTPHASLRARRPPYHRVRTSPGRRRPRSARERTSLPLHALDAPPLLAKRP